MTNRTTQISDTILMVPKNAVRFCRDKPRRNRSEMHRTKLVAPTEAQGPFYWGGEHHTMWFAAIAAQFSCGRTALRF